MSDIPPKNTPDPASFSQPGQESGVVAMYNAASHSGAEPFPVLKAFQDYIDAERQQARRRVAQLSILFAVVLVLVVAGFFVIGLSMVNNMTSLQSRLLDAALNRNVALAAHSAPQPVSVTPAPASVVPVLPPEVGKKLESLSALASNVHALAASKDTELASLRRQMQTMEQQNARLRLEMEKKMQPVVHTPTKPVPVAKVSPSAKKPNTPPASGLSSLPAVVSAKPVPAALPKVPVVVKKDMPDGQKPGRGITVDPRFPPATKEPPKQGTGVKAPLPPSGMISTAIPLKSKNAGVIPWRVMIPE